MKAQQPPAFAPAKLTIGVLHGFRALMVLFVCNYHIWQQSWLPQYFTVLGIHISADFFTRSSYLFVDGMLMMSGFLLFLPYAREKAEGIPVPGVKRFYFNRLVRILPSYLLSVLLLLFLVALPQESYHNTAAQTKDVLTHLTFTFTFWKETYLHTPLNGALWTVAIEMQFYLLFPALARCAQKKPVLTLCAMSAVGIAYRVILSMSQWDLGPLINQMPAFLDVYAIGMLGAMLYIRWRNRIAAGLLASLQKWVAPAAMLGFIAAIIGILQLLKIQSSTGLLGLQYLRLSQLSLRLPFALCMLLSMLSAAFMPRVLQKMLDNRLMHFLATISFNLYIWHQVLSAQMLKAFFPDTLRQDLPLQWGYTLLCYSVSILAAMLATYGVEKPVAAWAGRLYQKTGGMI